MTTAPQRPPIPDFASPAEFAELCDGIAARLHAKNRTGMGESVFVWEVAQLIRRAGRVLEKHLKDEAVQRAFGDGWQQGELPRDQHAAALFALMYPEMTGRKAQQ